MSKHPDSSSLREDTRIILSGRDPHRYGGMVNPPVFHVSTVLAESIEQLNARDHFEESGVQEMVYGCTGTPTSWALENAVAELEGGHRCLAYSSRNISRNGFALSKIVQFHGKDMVRIF